MRHCRTLSHFCMTISFTFVFQMRVAVYFLSLFLMIFGGTAVISACTHNHSGENHTTQQLQIASSFQDEYTVTNAGTTSQNELIVCDEPAEEDSYEVAAKKYTLPAGLAPMPAALIFTEKIQQKPPVLLASCWRPVPQRYIVHRSIRI